MIDAYSVQRAISVSVDDLDPTGSEILALAGIDPTGDAFLFNGAILDEYGRLFSARGTRVVPDGHGADWVLSFPPNVIRGMCLRGGGTAMALSAKSAAAAKEAALDWLASEAEDYIRHCERADPPIALCERVGEFGGVSVPRALLDRKRPLYYCSRERGEAFITCQPVWLGRDNLARSFAGQIHNAERDGLGEPEARLLKADGGSLPLGLRPGDDVAVVIEARSFQVWPALEWQSELTRRRLELKALGEL